MEALEEAKSLPPIEAFYNDLDQEELDEGRYQEAQQQWEFFQCRHMKDFMKIYLKCDTYLLAEVFEAYRRTVFQEFSMDPAYFYGVPGLAFECMLKISNIELELVHDPEIHDFLQKAKRGGVSLVCSRYEVGDPDLSNGQDTVKVWFYGVLISRIR